MEKLVNQIKNDKYKSSYERQFGNRVDLTDHTDPEILKTHKFSQVPCCCVVNEASQEILGNFTVIEM